MKSNKTRFAILGALGMWPMTGYDIRKVLENGIGRFWAESYGQLYPELRKLAEEGLLRKSEEASKGKNRVVYTLTSKGRTQLREWLAKPAVAGTAREEVLLKLFFGSQADPIINQEHLERFRTFHEECLRKCQRVKRSLTSSESEPDSVFWMITLLYNEQVSRALIAWCDEAQQLLSKK